MSIMPIVCNNETVGQLKNQLADIIKILKEYRWLLDSFVLDFFTENHWSKLPKSWQENLDKISLPEMADFLDYHHQPALSNVSGPLSLSLLCLREVAKSLALPRESVTGPQGIVEFLKNNENWVCKCIINSYKSLEDYSGNNEAPHEEHNSKKCKHKICNSNTELNKNNARIIKWESADHELSKGSGHHKKLQHTFRKCVKPKKQHEIYRLAQVVDLVTEFYPQIIVDIGAGQGHLSRLLSYNYKHTVVTLEAEDSHTSGAAKLDKQAEITLLKSFKVDENDDENLPSFNNLKHVTYCLSADASKEEFLRILKMALPNLDEDSLKTCCLLGLHTCGNLAPTMLRLFTSSEHVSALVSVACCYMKLSRDGFPLGYPLSQYVSSFTGHDLSYEALEVACHAIEHYCNKLKSGNATSLKIHCCRATLELLIQRSYPHLRHIGLRGVKKAEEIDFATYVQKAISKQELYIPSEDIASPLVDDCLKQWKRVVAFYSLRVLLAPLVETLILLDRMVYLFEHGISSILLSIFDPKISARNHVLIAIKSPNGR